MAKRSPKVEAPPTGPLGDFGGYPVLSMAIAVRNAGDGFADALEMAPRVHATGDETYFVLRCVTGPIDHDPLTEQGRKAKGDELTEFVGYRRVEDQVCVQAIEVDGERVREWLDESRTAADKVRAERKEREQLEAEQAAGVMRLVPSEGEASDEEWEGS